MRATVIHRNAAITLTSTVISSARPGWKRAASMMPQTTPTGVDTSRMGLAVRIPIS
jgi:hypothetical protein